MRHDYLDNTPVDAAKKLYYGKIKSAGFAGGAETVPSAQAHGRTLAAAVCAAICSPHYNASAMDGIAVNAADTYGASERAPVTLSPANFTVVDTGDPLPENTDAVIMVEDIAEEEDGSVKITAPVHPWQNVRQVGEDICMGDMIAPTGTRVSPFLCGAFLAGGVTEVQAVKRPRFGIIPTGDEIVSPTASPRKGEIIESNSTVFRAMLSEWDADGVVYPIVKDKKELLTAALNKAVSECDAVLILAGSSAGRDDYTGTVIGGIGEVCVHGIAAKPGKPAVLGIAGKVPIIGLPGYPVSAIVIMEEFVRELVDLWYNRPVRTYETTEAVLGRRAVSSLKYREYVRVSLGMTDGRLTAVPLPRGAGVITSMTKASGILEIPQNSEGVEAGETVNIRLLRDKQEIENALIITGSHDPLIDEAADLLKKRGCGFTVISSHVGSMGAITAVKSEQAHLGAVHLLDGETGIYNVSFIKKYFPDGDAVLVKGVGRVQGLMVAPGNPLGIKEFPDVMPYRYVNRQRGAGTRLLCDHLLSKYGLDPEALAGYYNEENTHTAAAAQIAAGNADAGLGIYSAAQMYGLDFIPVRNEEYDFLVAAKYADSPQVKAFFEVLRSAEFTERMNALGGYDCGTYASE